MELFKIFGKFAYDNGEESKMDGTVKKGQETESKMTSAFKKIGLAVAGAFTVKAVVGFGKECITMASDVQEMQNKFDVVFQGMTDDVEDWARTYADSIGRNRNEIKTYLADNQNMFVGMGMTREAGADLSEKMVQLGFDLASFNNLSEPDAVNALSKALMGETESAKRLGAVLNENTIALAQEQLGYEGKFQSLTEAEKMEVRYQAILNQSQDAIGDCERSQGSYKSELIRFQNTLANVKETIGGMLLPLGTMAFTFGTTCVKGIQGFVDILSDGEKRSETFKNVLSNMFSADFVDSLIEWKDYLTDIIKIFANNTIDMFASKIDGIKNMFSAFGDVVRPIVEGVINTLIMRFDTLCVIWNDVLVPAISLVIDIFTTMATTILSAVAPAYERVSQAFQKMQQTIQSVIQNFIIPIIGKFIDTIRALWEENQDKVQRIGEIFSEVSGAIATVIEWLVDKFQSILIPVFSWIKDVVFENMENIKAIWQIVWDVIWGICDTFISTIGTVVTAIQNFCAENEDKINAVGNVFSTVFAVIGDVIRELISWLTTNLVPTIQNLVAIAQEYLGNLQTIFQGVFDVIGGIIGFFVALFKGDWEGMWNSIKQIADGAIQIVTGLFEQMKLILSTIVNAIWSVMSTIWGTIFTTISNIVGKIKDGIVDKFTSAKETAVSVFEGLKTAVSTVWNGIWDVIKTVINSILGGIETMCNGVIKGINGLLSGIETVANAVGDVIGLDPIELSLSELSIPRLAKGGVLEKGQVGLLEGDGAEAVVPLEQNRKWINRVTTEFQNQGMMTKNDEMIGLMKQMVTLLTGINETNEDLPDNLHEAMSGFGLKVNNREFARLVKQC